VLPAGLVLAGPVVWVMLNRVPAWFVGAALGLTLMTFPVGYALIVAADAPEECADYPVACIPTAGPAVWLNGLHGLATLAGLALLTAVIRSILGIFDRRPRPQAVAARP
jgi:hypothetical protein